MPTALAAHLYFHAMGLMTREAGRKDLDIVRDSLNRTMAELDVQLELKAHDTLMIFLRLAPCWLCYSSFYGSILL